MTNKTTRARRGGGRTRPALQTGNTKLGPAIWSFSLPIAKSCKSATALCAKACYAKSGHFCWPSMAKSLAASWDLSRRANFADLVVAFCARREVRTVRVHVSGDFSDPAYVAKWVDVTTRLPGTKFFAYTRRWRDAKILGALEAFGSRPNVALWFSADAETGEPPRPKWFAGVAYMSLSDKDLPSYPVDLVFRDSSETVMKRTPTGSKVCPTDDGVIRGKKVTCSACKFCFSGDRVPVEGTRTPLPVL